MAKTEKSRYDWVRDLMPRVCKLVAEKREQHGADHIEECWQRSMAGEPNWFFAREGAIAIGTPWTDDPVCINFACTFVTKSEALVLVRSPEAAT